MQKTAAIIAIILFTITASAQRKAAAVPQGNITFKNMLGVNAFEWDFLNPKDPTILSGDKMDIIESFGGVRHYLDWQKIEPKKGSFTFNPAHDGGWNYDIIYQRCKQDGIDVVVCIKACPEWLLETYPPNLRDAENIPMPFGAKRDAPVSYIEQAKAGFQFAARYGSNKNVDPALVTVDPKQRWTGDGINAVKIGLGTVKYIECDNERDKWWKGEKAQQSAEEYAANMSAFYDGDKGRLGKGVGVKTADPNMKVVMAGLSKPEPGYILRMINWCKVHRGYKPDGSVNLCFDVINFHYYSGAPDTKRGVAPELSKAGDLADGFVRFGRAYHIPVWVTETGYDINPGSPQRAIAVGNKPVLITQADWIIRTSFLYARHGISKVFFYELNDDNTANPTQFASSGLADKGKRRPAADYIYQAKNLLGNYSYVATISKSPLVDVYRNGSKTIYALMMPGESGSSIITTLNLGNAANATKYQFNPGSNDMIKTPLTTPGHNVQIKVGETPVFVEKVD
jgi:hypothetical protein